MPEFPKGACETPMAAARVNPLSRNAYFNAKQIEVGAVELQRGCERITAPYLQDRSARIAASLKLDSSHL